MFLLLMCHSTHVVNTSKYEWTQFDQSMLERAKVRCGQLYEDAPCLKWFKKYDFQSYSALCGAEKDTLD